MIELIKDEFKPLSTLQVEWHNHLEEYVKNGGYLDSLMPNSHSMLLDAVADMFETEAEKIIGVYQSELSSPENLARFCEHVKSLVPYPWTEMDLNDGSVTLSLYKVEELKVAVALDNTNEYQLYLLESDFETWSDKVNNIQ